PGERLIVDVLEIGVDGNSVHVNRIERIGGAIDLKLHVGLTFSGGVVLQEATGLFRFQIERDNRAQIRISNEGIPVGKPQFVEIGLFRSDLGIEMINTLDLIELEVHFDQLRATLNHSLL